MTDTIIEILIDFSGSMGFMKGTIKEGDYLIDGVTRMKLIKQIIRDHVIPTIDYANQVTIRIFRIHRKKIGNKVIDENIVTVIYQGTFDEYNITKRILSLPDPGPGGTPITAAINAAVENLSKYPNSDRKIILLTDGEENGGGDYQEAAKNAEQLNGIPCKIFIIGLAQNEQSERKSRSIATGGYCNIKAKSFTLNEVEQVLTPLKAAVLQNTIHNNQIAVNNNQPQQHIKSQEIVNTHEKKIETVKQGSVNLTSLQLDKLETRIKEQISNIQNLLSELSSLKELLRVNALLETGIDSTTLTIDYEYSESIRQRSETFLYKLLCDKYGKDRVKWLNQTSESYRHHDFELLDENEKVIQLIECKGTAKEKPTFYLTASEWEYFLSNKEIYQIYRVFNVAGEMTYYCISNLHSALINGQIVPYLLKVEIMKEGRVYLTLKK